MWNIIEHRNTFFVLSGVLIAASLLAMLLFGFRQSIEFTGGTLWRVRIEQAVPPPTAVAAALREKAGIDEVQVTRNENAATFLIRLSVVGEEDHQRVLRILQSEFPSLSEVDFQSIGPSIGATLKRNAFIAIGLVLGGISLYIAFAFRKVSRPISSWKYGWVTLFTLLHDIVVPAGLLAVLGSYAHVEVDGNFVVALLVVAGFSVHDTIVVFDRIRENLLLDRGKTALAPLINLSVNQTLRRSINTSFTLILVLLALYFIGPANIQYFVLTLLVGVLVGIYSSVFVASPILLLTSSKR